MGEGFLGFEYRQETRENRVDHTDPRSLRVHFPDCEIPEPRCDDGRWHAVGSKKACVYMYMCMYALAICLLLSLVFPCRVRLCQPGSLARTTQILTGTPIRWET